MLDFGKSNSLCSHFHIVSKKLGCQPERQGFLKMERARLNGEAGQGICITICNSRYLK